MKDKNSIKKSPKIISAIFKILLIILFIFLIPMIWLKVGFSINEVSFNHIHIQKLYLKWNDKLDLSIKNITITTKSTQTNQKFSIKELHKKLENIKLIPKYFENIDIKSIYVDNKKASFKFNKKEKGFIKLEDKNFKLYANIYCKNSKEIILKIKQIKAKNINLSANANIVLTKDKIYLNSNLNINNDIYLKVSAISTQDKLVYKSC